MNDSREAKPAATEHKLVEAKDVAAVKDGVHVPDPIQSEGLPEADSREGK